MATPGSARCFSAHIAHCFANEKISIINIKLQYYIDNIINVPVTTSTDDRIRRLLETQNKTMANIAILCSGKQSN